MTDTPARRPVFDLVVIDCPDALVEARFYAELLGWVIEDGADASWATVQPPEGAASQDAPGGPPSLAFQQIEDWLAPTWPGGAHPQQLHLDFSVGDIDAAEPSILALGARRHDHQPSSNGNFRVYLDPAGHPFCLIR